MAIRSTRYCSDAVAAHAANAGTSGDAAIVKPGVVDFTDDGGGEFSVAVSGGHNYAVLVPGDALTVLRGTDVINTGTYEIVGRVDANILTCAYFDGAWPGVTPTPDATIRINGPWTLNASGGNEAAFAISPLSFGPLPGDTVLVVLVADGPQQGKFESAGTADWALEKPGTAFKPITYRGASDGFVPLTTRGDYVKIVGSGASHSGMYAQAANIIVEHIWPHQESQTSTYGFRLQDQTIRNCKSTGANWGVAFASSGNAISCVIDSCVIGVLGPAGAGVQVFDNDISNCSTAGVMTGGANTRLIIVFNRFLACDVAVVVAVTSASTRAMAIISNSIHGGTTGIDFTSDTGSPSAAIISNAFSGLSGYCVGASGSASAGFFATLLNNAWFGGLGLYDSSNIGVIEAGTVTLAKAPFVDPAGGDWRLVAGSLARNAGLPNGDIGANQVGPVAMAGLQAMGAGL